VGIGESASVAVGKSLVPEDALGIPGHVVDAEDFIFVWIGEEFGRGGGMHVQVHKMKRRLVGGWERGGVQGISGEWIMGVGSIRRRGVGGEGIRDERGSGGSDIGNVGIM
jgi:hypothetical protein